MRLTGFEAIAHAEQEGLLLNKAPDRIDDGRADLTIAEAEAIASEDASLIWIEVPEREYYGEPRNMEPGADESDLRLVVAQESRLCHDSIPSSRPRPRHLLLATTSGSRNLNER